MFAHQRALKASSPCRESGIIFLPIFHPCQLHFCGASGEEQIIACASMTRFAALLSGNAGIDVFCCSLSVGKPFLLVIINRAIAFDSGR